MPLYKKIFDTNFEIAVWQIEEDYSFFENKFHSSPEIKNENQRLQWYATRHLTNELLGFQDEILKDEFGKPFLKSSEKKISLSHTSQFAAVILSKNFEVGIDLEAIHPKVERIAHKFLREDEINSIKPEEKIQKLILYWSAKESLYKLHGQKQLEFKTQLLIKPFELKSSGTLNAEIKTEMSEFVNMQYEFFNNHVMTYVVGR